MQGKGHIKWMWAALPEMHIIQLQHHSIKAITKVVLNADCKPGLRFPDAFFFMMSS